MTTAVAPPLALALALALAVLATSPAFGQSKRMIVLYDPDANHQALVDITANFNVYVASVGGAFELQPVESRTAFEQVLTDNHPPFAIVSSLVLRSKWAAPFELDPLLVPSSKGDSFYRKVLVTTAGRELTSLQDVSTGVAVIDVDPKAAGLDALLPLQAAGFSTTGAVIVPVSKDIDALLALAFRQVEAALVTTKSLDVLRRVNPSVSNQLKAVKETVPVLRSPLCSVGKNPTAEETALVTHAFAAMGSSESGARLMRLLGFDAWTPYRKAVEQ